MNMRHIFAQIQKEAMELGSLKGPAELLASKVKAFKNCLELASECLTHKDYSNAEMIYGSILADLHKDCFIEALNLNDLDLFSLHSCFAYSSIGADYKSEQALVILNSIHKPIKLPLIPYLKAFIHISNDRISFAKDELKCCQTLLNDGYNFKPNNILNENIVPEINDEFLKLKLNGLRFACELLKAKEDNDEMKRCFKENWLKIGKLCESDFANFANKSDSDEVTKETVVIIEKKCIQNHVNGKTGTIKKTLKVQKNKMESIAVQVNPPKMVNVAVQTTEKEIASQILNTVLDIRNKMNNLQNKKDNEIKQLQKKNSELNDKLLAKESRRQEKLSEFEFMKSQYFVLEKKFEESQKQVEFLQKLLIEQLQQKYCLQKNIYHMFEEKCGYKIEYFSDLQQYLKAGDRPSSDECKQEISMWKNSLHKIISAKKNFDVFYRNVDDLVVSKKFSSIKTNDWPGIPHIPTDMQDIIHRTFKIFIQQDKPLHNVVYPNYATLFGNYKDSYFNPSYFVNNYTNHNQDGRITGSPPTFSRVIGTAPYRQNVEDKSHSSYYRTDITPEPPSPSFSEETSHIYRTENDLLKFLQSKFENTDEIDLLQAIYHVRDTHGGNLTGFPRIVLVNEIKKYFKKTKGSKTWTNVAPVQWQSDHEESKCCICFEDYNPSNSHSLPCKHEFHKKCITNWLKRQSACPVCRVHAVIEDEYPPLKA